MCIGKREGRDGGAFVEKGKAAGTQRERDTHTHTQEKRACARHSAFAVCFLSPVLVRECVASVIHKTRDRKGKWKKGTKC